MPQSRRSYPPEFRQQMVELDRLAGGVEYKDKTNIGRWSAAKEESAMPRKHLVHSLQDDPEPRPATAAPGDVSGSAAGDLHPAPRTGTGRPRHRSVPGARTHGPWPARLSASPFLGFELEEGYFEETLHLVETSDSAGADPRA